MEQAVATLCLSNDGDGSSLDQERSTRHDLQLSLVHEIEAMYAVEKPQPCSSCIVDGVHCNIDLKQAISVARQEWLGKAKLYSWHIDIYTVTNTDTRQYMY